MSIEDSRHFKGAPQYTQPSSVLASRENNLTLVIICIYRNRRT